MRGIGLDPKCIPATTPPSSLEDQLNWLSSIAGEQYSIIEELGKKLAPLTLPADQAAESSVKDPSSMTSPACERLRSLARSLDYHNNMIKSLMQNLTL